MRFNFGAHWQNPAKGLGIAFGALGWLALISLLHFWLNTERDGGRRTVSLGYMPVISNLASPLLDHASRDSGGVRFRALKFASFAEMAESLRHGQIDAAFIIAPLAIVLRQQGEDVKIVYIGNRHESTLVVRKGLNAKGLRDLAGKKLAVPMLYSGHSLAILKRIQEEGVAENIEVVEMNPPDMAVALSTGSLDAYFVGEPFAAQTLKSGHADLLYYVEDHWENFICNLVVVRQSLIEEDPEAVRTLVQGAARSGLWAERNPKQVARIASLYWNQPVELIEYALTTPEGRIRYDRFAPKQDEMQYMANLMHHFGLSQSTDITGLVEDRFARNADLSGIDGLETILR